MLAVTSIVASEETFEYEKAKNIPNELQKLANPGDAKAQFILSLMYYNGEGVRPDLLCHYLLCII
jgi:TPR repeat protein